MTDELLEEAIEEVGRDRVLERAASLGWTAYCPPEKWVWWEIVRSLQLSNPTTSQSGPLASDSRSDNIGE